MMVLYCDSRRIGLAQLIDSWEVTDRSVYFLQVLRVECTDKADTDSESVGAVKPKRADIMFGRKKAWEEERKSKAKLD